MLRKELSKAGDREKEHKEMQGRVCSFKSLFKGLTGVIFKQNLTGG